MKKNNKKKAGKRIISIVIPATFLFLFFFVCLSAPLNAQTINPSGNGNPPVISPEEKARREQVEKLTVIRIKERSENHIAAGLYTEALKAVNEGLEEFPKNSELIELKKHIVHLIALSEGEKSDPKEEMNPEGEHNKDHFKIKSRPPERVENILDSRNSFFIGVKGTVLHSLEEQPTIPFDFTDSSYFAFGPSFSFRFYPTFFNKLIGLSIDYDGMYLNFNDQGTSERYLHNPNVGLVLRGIMYEEPRAKMILGLGVSMGLLVRTSLADNNGLYDSILKVNVFFEDPFIYHLFRVPQAKGIIFKGEANFNYLFINDIFYLDYELGLYYRFNFFEAGMYFGMTDNNLSDFNFEIITFGISCNFLF